MNTIIAVGIIVLIIAIVIYLFMPRNKIIERGFFGDLPEKFDILLNSKPEITSIIIEVSGTEDFIQFSRNGEDVEMDYPVITLRQKELSARYREFCSKEDLSIRETTGSDGSLFLDVDVPSRPNEIAKICQSVLINLFDASPETKLGFTLLP